MSTSTPSSMPVPPHRRTYSVGQTIKNTIVENFGGGDKLASDKDQFSLDDVPSQSGKVAVVTGGSEGIGFGVAHTLLDKDIKKLFILSRTKETVEGAKASVAKELGQEKADRTHWIYCDLSDWASIPAVAEQIAKETDRIDIIVNNAARGIMTYQLTDFGVDTHMALNHMGHVILTSHLLPVVKKTAADGNTVRIVNLASNAHQGAPSDTKFANLEELNRDLGPNGQYGRSKLATLLYARYLGKHLTSKHPNILVNASHPGFVKTRQSEEYIHEAYPLAGFAMSVGMAPFKKDQFEGALSTLYCATATNSTGKYICPPAIEEQGSNMAQDDALAEQLMKLTVELVTEKTRSQSVDKGCPMQLY